MARLPRFVIPDQPQHVIVRGNNRSDIFCADTDYQFYLEKLQLACDKHDCRIHAYVLMTKGLRIFWYTIYSPVMPEWFCRASSFKAWIPAKNTREWQGCGRGKLVISESLTMYICWSRHTREDGLSKVMQMLGRYYVQYYNYTYQRTGTLWEGRYKATLIDSEAYLLTCMRYIELNPVRADMVAHPSDYPWSSYRFNALGQSNELLNPHLEYLRLCRFDEARQAVWLHM